jgi:hypothetical protein
MLLMVFGLDRNPGLTGPPVLDGAVGLLGFDVAIDWGIATDGPVPDRVDSDGFLVQENMSAPGICQPLLQPV